MEHFIPQGAYVYMLRCSDDSLYTGSTKNIIHRYKQHQSGAGANYTAKRLPVKLIYLQQFLHIGLAYEREKQIQKWRKVKKLALVFGKDNLLPKLATAYYLRNENTDLDREILEMESTILNLYDDFKEYFPEIKTEAGDF